MGVPVLLHLDYVYDDTYQPHAVKQITLNSSAAYDYTYDDNGNMASGPDFTNPAAVAARSITYNADNMPIAIVHGGAVTTSFVYDGNGVRAKKVVSGGATTYYIGEHYEIKDGVGIKYIFAGSRRVAKIVGNTVYYFHKDHLGSSTVMTDAAAGQVEYTDYLPFGGQRENTGPTLAGYRYTDQELDPSTGLYNYDARLYDPVIGRFISADSIVPDWFNPQSFNRYAYVLNNPLAYVDPSGHDAESTWLNWLKTNPRERVGEQRFNYATRESKKEALPYLRQFQSRLRYMESKGVNVDNLSVDTLDQEYVTEREEARGIYAISAGALFGPAAAKTKGTTNASKETLKITKRTTRGGDSAVRIEYPDGRIKDISPKRVKEYVPNTHPKAPPGTKQKVKFDDALPGSKGYKRAPTADEMKQLEKK